MVHAWRLVACRLTPLCGPHCGRPAVIISFAIAAVSALLSALCYAEFATEVPITGGAFSYTTLTFGPLVGW
jgi:APA family basic amino acid/polyamine antiporter